MKKMKALIVLLCILLLSTDVYAEMFHVSIAMYDNHPVYSRAQKIMDEIALASGHDITIILRYLPNKRAVASIESNLTDGDVGRSIGAYKNSDNVLIVNEYIIKSNYYVFSKKDIRIENWRSLNSYQVIASRGDKVVESKLEDIVKNIHFVNNYESAVNMLISDRGDAFVGSMLIVWPIYQRLKCEEKGIKILKPEIASVPMYLFLHKKHQNLVVGFTTAIKSMKQKGRIRAILSGE